MKKLMKVFIFTNNKGNEIIWTDDSYLETIITLHYKKEKYGEIALNRDLKIFENHTLYKLKQWRKLTEKEKDVDEYPRGIRKLLDGITKVFFYL
jgi:hypothetical protein